MIWVWAALYTLWLLAGFMVVKHWLDKDIARMTPEELEAFHKAMDEEEERFR